MSLQNVRSGIAAAWLKALGSRQGKDPTLGWIEQPDGSGFA